MLAGQDSTYLLIRKAGAFIRKDFTSDIRNTFGFLERWLGILRTVLLFYFFSQFIGGKGRLPMYGGDYFSFILVGIACKSYLEAPMKGFFDTVAREGWIGTFEVLLTTPTKIRTLFLSFAPYNLFMGLCAACFHILLGWILGMNLYHVNALAVLVIIILATIIFSGFGILSASFWIAFRKNDPVIWLVSNLFWLLGGLYFPVTIFPKFLQIAALYIPTTYIFRALRLAFLRNYSLGMLQADIIALLIFSAILSILSILAFKKALLRAQRLGIITFS